MRFAVYDVPRDGHCLFSSVAMAIGLEQGMRPTPKALSEGSRLLRETAVSILRREPSHDVEAGLSLRDLVEASDLDAYCENMRSDSWGSTAEVVALTYYLRRPIHVHTTFGVQTYGYRYSNPLHVMYDGCHYKALHPSRCSPLALLMLVFVVKLLISCAYLLNRSL